MQFHGSSKYLAYLLFSRDDGQRDWSSRWKEKADDQSAEVFMDPLMNFLFVFLQFSRRERLEIILLTT